MIRDVYAFLCVFSGVGLLPFGLEKVEKQGSARKPVILAFLTVCGIVLGMQVLLPAVFGKNRLLAGNISGAASSGRGRSSGKCAGKI